jgi:hypothetical protein
VNEWKQRAAEKAATTTRVERRLAVMAKQNRAETAQHCFEVAVAGFERKIMQWQNEDLAPVIAEVVDTEQVGAV